MFKLNEGAESFYYPGGKVGCLLIHFYGGAPHGVHWLGQYLNQQGHTVYGPRLAGHGTDVHDLAKVTWREWYADALSGYRMLRSHCDKVYVMGVSLGAILSLTLAAHEPVDGVVAMGVAHHIDSNWLRRMAYRVMAALNVIIYDPPPPPEQDKTLQRILAEQRARGEKPIGRVLYHALPTRSTIQLAMLMEHMRAGLPSISAPALFIHSRGDHVVPLANMEIAFDAVGSIDKHKLILDSDRHGISEHPDIMGEAFEAIGKFIAERANP